MSLAHLDQRTAIARLHKDARVAATVVAVEPGEPTVTDIATSGEPVVVRDLPAGPRPERRAGARPHRRRAGGGRRSGRTA